MSYASAFQRFLRVCDQRRNLFYWFRRNPLPRSVKTLLSIGAGTGQIESELIKTSKRATVHATLIEPNRELAAEIDSYIPSSQTSIVTSTFEDYRDDLLESGQTFDFILLSHSMYYFEKPRDVLNECYNLFLNEGGKLVVINESESGIHDFRKNFGNHKDMLLSDLDVLSFFPGYVKMHVIDGYFSTKYLRSILPFVLPNIPPEELQEIEDDVAEYAKMKYGDNIYQPSVVLTTTK